MAVLSSPSTSLHRLGSGILYIGEWSGETPPSVWSDVGNCSKLEVNLEEEKLDHYSKRTNLKTKDKTVTLTVGYSADFDLDEISQANLSRFFKATISDNKILGLTGTDKEFALKFVANNVAGENQTWLFYKGTLGPASAHALISDDWSILSYTFEGESDVDNHPESPYFDIIYPTTTTTTTTTTAA